MKVFFTIFAISYLIDAYRRHLQQAWRNVAIDLDLEYSKGFLDARSLRGEFRGFDVVITISAEEKRPQLVAEVHGIDPGFTLGRDSALLRMVKADIETGDRGFDERTRIEGDEKRALAALGDEARRLTEIMITENHGELKNQVLRVKLGGLPQTESTLDLMVDLAHHLRRLGDDEIPVLLGERALHDSSQGVRLQALRQLSALPHSEQIRSVAEELLATPSASLRVEACRLLLRAEPEQSASAARELADLVVCHQVESSTRRLALAALAESEHRELAIPAMSKILRQPNEEPAAIRRAALDGLVRAGAKEELLGFEPVGPAEAEALARGLGLFDISVQSRLLALLEHPEDRVRLAATHSLGRVGGLDSVAALRQVAGKKALIRSALARAAEHAIGEIKSRADGSQRGEISLVALTPLEGAVSPADDSETGGEVSLTP